MTVEIATLGAEFDTSGLKPAVPALNQVRNAGNDAADSLDRAGARAKSSADAIGNAFRQIQGVIAALSLIKLTQQVAAINDEYSQLQGRLGLVTESSAELLEVQEKLYRLAQASRSPYAATASLYADMAAAATELNATQSEMLLLTGGVGASLVIAGRSAGEAKGALFQLGQLMGGSVVQAQEYNALIDNMRPLLVEVAKNLEGTGGTVAGLTKLVKEGKVPTAAFFQAAVDGSQSLIDKARGMDLTAVQALTNLENAYKKAVANADMGPLIASITELTEKISDPQLQQAVTELAAGLITLAQWAVEAAGSFSKLGQNIGEAFARMQGAIVPEAEIERLQELQRVAREAGNTFEVMAREKQIAAVREEFGHLLKQGPIVIDYLKGLTVATAKYSDAVVPLRIETEAYAKVQGEAARKSREDEAARKRAADAAQAAADAIAKAQQKLEAETRQIELQIDLRAQGIGAVEAETRARLILAGATEAQIEAHLRARRALEDLNETADSQAESLNRVLDAINPVIAAQEAYDESLEAGIRLEQIGLVTKAELAQFERTLALAREDAAKAMRDQLDPAGALIRSLTEENAALAAGINLEQEREYARLRSLGATEEQIKAIRQLREEQQVLNDLLGGNQNDPTQALRSGFEELRDTLVDLSTESGRFSTLLVSGLEDITTAARGVGVASKLSGAEQQRAFAAAAKSGLSGFAALTAGAAGFFDEQSSGYKTLTQVSQVFHAAELAMSVAELVPKAIGAVLNQGNGDPYSAFGRMAAMAAFVAALGVSVGGSAGGGGGGYKPPVAGTGTVLGDPSKQSESLANALEQLVDLQGSGLYVSEAMLATLRQIEAGINGVGDLLFRANASTGGGATPFAMATERSDSTLSAGINRARVDFRGFTHDLTNILTGGVLGAVDNLLGGALSQIHDIASGIGGKIISGLFGSTKVKQIDSGLQFDATQTFSEILLEGLNATYYGTIEITKKKAFGLSKSRKVRDELAPLEASLEDQFTDIIVNLGNSALEAVELLGLNATAAAVELNKLPLEIGKISTQGKSAEDVQKELSAAFSGLGDRFADAVLPGIVEFQKVGEGLYETLIRVASQTAAVTDVLSSMGLDFEGLDTMLTADPIKVPINGVLTQIGVLWRGMTEYEKAMERARISDRLIEMAGGIDTFAENVSTYLDKFLTEEQKAERLRAQLTEQFVALNVALPPSRDGIRSLVSGLDITTESGREAFTILTALSGQLGQYYDELEAREEERQDLLRSVTDRIEEITLPAEQLKLLRLDREFEAMREEAERLDLETTLIDQLYELERAAILAGGAVQEFARERLAFDQRFETQIARQGLSGEGLDLFDLEQRYTADLAEAQRIGANILAVEEYYGRERERIVTRYAEEAIEAARRAAEEEARIAEQAAADAIRLAQQRSEFTTSLQQQIDDFGLEGITAELRAVERRFEALRAEAEALDLETTLIDELEALEIGAIRAAEAMRPQQEAARQYADQLEFMGDLQRRLADFGLEGLDADLRALERDMAALREQAAALNLNTTLIDQIEAVERSALLAAEALRQQEAATAALARRTQFDDDIQRQITQSGLSGESLDLFNLERERQEAIQRAEEVGGSLAEVERLYGIKRQQIAAQYADEALRIQQEAADREMALQRERAEFVGGLSNQIARSGLTGQALDLFDLDLDFAQRRARAQELGAGALEVEELYWIQRQAIIDRYTEEALQRQSTAVEDARGALREAYGLQADELRGIVDRFTGIGDELRKYRGELGTGPSALLNPMTQYAAARQQLEQLQALADTGDEQAMRQLRDAGNVFLEASKAVNASGAAYFADLDLVRAAVDSALGAADFEATLAQQQLDAMTAQVSELITLNESVLSVEEAIQRLTQVLGGGAPGSTLPLMESTPLAPLQPQPSPAAPTQQSVTDRELIAELREQNRHLQALVNIQRHVGERTIEHLAAIDESTEEMSDSMRLGALE